MAVLLTMMWFEGLKPILFYAVDRFFEPCKIMMKKTTWRSGIIEKKNLLSVITHFGYTFFSLLIANLIKIDFMILRTANRENCH